MEIQILGGTSKQIEDGLFQLPYNEPLVHQVVNSYLISSRYGSKSQKTRSEVRGGGKKPWRQKGTGRARSGTASSPLWRGGGVTFAAKPGCYKQKVNKKMYSLAVRTILSELYRQDRMAVTNSIVVDSPKTKKIVDFVLNLGVGLDLLLVVYKIDTNLLLAVRNLPKIKLIDVNSLNPLDLVFYKKILFEEKVIDSLSARYLGKGSSIVPDRSADDILH